MLRRYQRELAAAAAWGVLLVAVAFVAPSFFRADNLRDLALNNAPLLLVATGMTLVILVGRIDISVGSQFAIVSVCAGLLAKSGAATPLLLLSVLALGAGLGAVNGLLVARLGLPSIIATLATLVAWRDGLRWATEGAWVQDLPPDFQWFGLGQASGQRLIVAAALVVLVGLDFLLRHVAAGRAVYAVGSDREAARLAGIEPDRVIFWVFVLMGALTGLAAYLNAARFSAVPGNIGIGLELKAVAAVVVGGTAIRGGRGTLLGTLVGVALLGTIGPALTYAGINPFWEKAIQGGIILGALASDRVLGRLERHAPAIAR
ncbi:MAG TPA: ABC transporter permease [Planctomycetota bacterium]|nr:ABC transporter permease [Planctomycetota bacterium]